MSLCPLTRSFGHLCNPLALPFDQLCVPCLCQVTAFVSLLALDTARLEARRVDCLPCLQLPQAESGDLNDLLHDSADSSVGPHGGIPTVRSYGSLTSGAAGAWYSIAPCNPAASRQPVILYTFAQL